MLISHSLIYLLGRGCSGIINFLAIVIYTRLISPEEYGQYAMIIAISGLVNTAVFQWMSVGLVRYLPGLKEERHQQKSVDNRIGTPVVSRWF
jgi:O-antigen/teichoic acid export membrane protein